MSNGGNIVTLTSRAAGLLPDSLFTRSVAYSFRRFEVELPMVVAAFPRGGVALDVGTWYGPWTYWLAKRASHVHSFELSHPDVARVLRERTVAANVTAVHQVAASDVTGNRHSSPLPSGGKGTEGRATLEGLDETGTLLR